MVVRQRTTRRIEDTDPSLQEGSQDALTEGEETTAAGDGSNLLSNETLSLEERLAAIEERERQLAAREMELSEAAADLDAAHRELQGKRAMLTTETMPGGDLIRAPRRIEVSQATAPPRLTFYKGNELGKCERTVVAVGEQSAPHAKKNITFEPGRVYTIEFTHGRAQVPTVIADYIGRENPGGNLRLA